MNTHQVERYCSHCEENYNCIAYISMNFTQMYGCIGLYKTKNDIIKSVKINKNKSNKKNVNK